MITQEGSFEILLSHLKKGKITMIERITKKFKAYTKFGNDRMYLNQKETGEDLIIYAKDRFEAFVQAIENIRKNSNYSEPMTEKWIESHPLFFEEIKK